MDTVNKFKDFVASTINLLMQFWPESDPEQPAQALQPPFAQSSYPETQTPSWVDAQTPQSLNWSKIVVAFCFASGLAMALLSVQPHTKFPLTFHIMLVAILLSFASLFVSKFIGARFPVLASKLEQVGVFIAATAFFIAVTIPFPPSLKFATWVVYALSLLAIFICNTRLRF